MEEKYRYFKGPWLKWLMLGLGIAHLFLLKENIQNCIISAQSGIYSPSELEKYLTQREFSCVTGAMLVTLFIGSFLIDLFAKSKRWVKNGNMVLLILMTLELGLPLLILRPAMRGMGIVWVVLFAITLLLTVWNFYEFLREAKKMKSDNGSKQ